MRLNSPERGDHRRYVPSWRTAIPWLASAYVQTAFGLLASTLVGTALGSISLIVAARVYSPSDLGTGAAVIALAALAGTIGSVGLGTGLMRFLPISGGSASTLIRSAYSITFLLSGVITAGTLLVLVAATQIDELFLSLGGVALLIVGAAANGITLVQDGVLVSARRSRLLVVRVTAGGAIRLITLVLLAPVGALGYVAAWAVSLAVPVIALIRIGAPPGAVDVDSTAPVRLRDVLAFSGRTYALDIVGTVAPATMPSLILALAGPAESAYFTVPFVGAMLAYAIGRAAAVALFAEAARPGADVRKGGRRAIAFGVGQLIPIVILTWVLAAPVLGLFGADYQDHAAWPLRLLVLSALPNAVVSPYFAIRRLQGRFRTLFAVTGIGAMVSIGGATLWIPGDGATGAAAGMLIGQTAMMLMVSLAALSKRRRIK